MATKNRNFIRINNIKNRRSVQEHINKQIECFRELRAFKTTVLKIDLNKRKKRLNLVEKE